MTAAPTGDGIDPHVERYRAVAHDLHEIAKPVRVLGSLTWPASVRETFLASGGNALPEVEYPPFDEEPIVEAVHTVRRSIYPGDVVDDWLESVANSIEHTARMLAARGTASFLTHSQALYGTPRTPLRYDPVTPYELAQRVGEVLVELSRVGLAAEVPHDHSAEEVAAILESGVVDHFGPDDAPDVLVVDELSANALATTSQIKVRAGARFTARDAAQLLNHEAFIHVLTGINGRHQTDLPILALGHPGTTRTQEGLAVFAEFVSGTLELDPADGADRDLLTRSGWKLVDTSVAATPNAYRAYVTASTGELMVAKNMYVQTTSGWFSDRSACYLASGRPVLAQDTGLAELLPTGEGLVTFSTLDEAAAGAERIVSDYRRHSGAARAVAEEHFGSDRVLGRLLARLGGA